jgi:hypothetical protein
VRQFLASQLATQVLVPPRLINVIADSQQDRVHAPLTLWLSFMVPRRQIFA